jgi:hypothetical protein
MDRRQSPRQDGKRGLEVSNIFEEFGSSRKLPEIAAAEVALLNAIAETDRQHEAPHPPYLRSIERGELHGIPVERWRCTCGWTGCWWKRGWLR